MFTRLRLWAYRLNRRLSSNVISILCITGVSWLLVQMQSYHPLPQHFLDWSWTLYKKSSSDIYKNKFQKRMIMSVTINNPLIIKQVVWKHFISWGRNFVIWRRQTYSLVLDFVDCPTHEIEKNMFDFWQMRNWGLTLKQGQLRNYGLASDSAYCLTSHLKIMNHHIGSMFSQPSLIRQLLWHQTVN